MTTTEQMAVADTEQSAAASEQVTPVAEMPAGAVADVVERAVADLDLSTPDGIRAFLAQHPASQAVLADERNAERQRVQGEIRRESGTLENIRKHNAEIARRIANGEDPDEIANETPLYVKANADVIRSEMYRALFEQAKAVDPDATAALEALVNAPDVSADQLEQYTQSALNAVSSRAQRTALQQFLDSDDIDALPDSKLKTAIQSRIAREAEVEVNARTVEANKPDAIPSAPAGSSTEPMTRQRLDAMTSTERTAYIASLPDAERSNLWSLAMTPA